VATLTVLIYFSVCGGAFGMEPLVGAVGPGWAAALIIGTPIIYSLPISLMAAELTALMPEEGGYYVWVREAFGRFWAVQESWWTFAFGLLQLASFPVLFVAYLGYVLTHVGGGLIDPAWLTLPWVKWGIAAAVIVSGTVVNLMGAIDVGRSALIALGLVLGSFLALLVGWAVSGHTLAQSTTVIVHDVVSNRHTDLLLGLSVIVFNYSAWEKASSYAGEVDRPQRTYPIALTGSLVLTVLSYLVPVVAGVGATTDASLWSADAGWPAIAERIGGPALGITLALGGMVSMWSLFSAVLLWVSRIPSVLASDGWLPRRFMPSHRETAVPVASVLLVSALTAALAAYSFGDLVIVQNLAYTASLVLEILALLYFRHRLPDAPRVFRVPGGTLGMVLTCALPLLFSAAVIVASFQQAESFRQQLVLTSLVAAGGVALYVAGRRRAIVSRR
jgi:amino acid transporter